MENNHKEYKTLTVFNWDWKEINFPTQINECKKS